MSPLQLSSIQCIKRVYEFSDGSIVRWTPLDNSNKAHGLFRVDICLRSYGDIRASVLQKKGPPSENSSLHWLKCEIKDYMQEMADKKQQSRDRLIGPSQI